MNRTIFVGQILLALLLVFPPVARGDADEKLVLFDGTDLSQWTHRDGRPVQWKLLQDGAMEVVAGSGDIVSKQTFGDCVIHVEFMPPKMPPEVKGQGRGNSGVYVQGRYEVQVLDSWGVQSGKGDCGAIYGIKAPDNNACKPPGEWQVYEITFRAARFDDAGEKIQNARISVKQNGVVIHKDFELPHHTPGGIGGEAPEPGPILLQEHGDPVRFRNIWVRPIAPDQQLDDADDDEAHDPPATTQAALRPQRFNDLLPGVVGQYFQDVEDLDELQETSAKPFLVRIDEQLQFKEAHGEFHGTKLNNNFGVRWSGVLRVKEEDWYTLGLYSDDRSRLFIDDELIVDNTLPEKRGAETKVHLAAGDYPIRIDYHQGPGSARFHFSWKTSRSEDWEDIPTDQLFHREAQARVEWDQAAWAARTWDRQAYLRDWAAKYEKMDYGTFIAHTIVVDDQQTVNKGIAIRLGSEPDEAAVVFDTELLRYAAGWTGGYLQLDGIAFNMAHGKNPSISGQIAFSTKPQTGWGGTTDFADPRTDALGNLPRQRGHFKGLYRHGERIILSYTVGNRTVLDMPSFVTIDGQGVFLRSLEIGPGDREVWLNLTRADAQEPNATRIEPSSQATLITVDMTNGRIIEAAVNGIQEVPSKLCSGGPARWPQTIHTKGALGTGGGAYVVDSVEVPEENPWNAWMRFGGIDFFSDGRAALSTLSGDVWLVSGLDETLEKVTWKRFAAGLFQPLGLKIVDDQVYVLGRDQITRLHDLNGDGEADFYENFNNDCIVTASFHEFAFDLQTDLEGNFYFAKGGPVRPGGRGWEQVTPHSGCVFKVSKDGSSFEVFATGLRAPNGMGAGPDGQLSVADNEGTWTPTCRLSFVRKGSFLGVLDLSHHESAPYTYDPPICWLPHKEVDNSSGGQVWSGERWGPLSGRMLHMSYGRCDLFLVMLDDVDGVTQGGVVKFPLSFDTGICRARVHPVDGQIYVTGLKGWQTRAAKDGALQRIRYTGNPLAMPSELKIGSKQITIGFTCELDEELAVDPDSWAIEQWNYIWSSDYGSPEVTVEDPTKKGHDPVEIESISLSPDRRSVMLKIPSLRPVMQMKIQMKLEAADGTPVEYEIYNTINKVPGGGTNGR